MLILDFILKKNAKDDGSYKVKGTTRAGSDIGKIGNGNENGKGSPRHNTDERERERERLS